MLSAFILDGTVTYRPLSGETYESAVRKTVLDVTEEDYRSEFEKRQEQSLAKAKAVTEPETFFEFRTFISERGEEAFTDEQLARYDALHADMLRDGRKTEKPTTVQKFENEDLQDYAFTRKEGYHEKRECPLYIVQLQSRVEREAFNELNRKAKMLGGWYSSFKRDDAGFQFLVEDQADRFCALLSGDVNRADVLAARKERKELTASERLHELAAELHTRAEETIEQSNGSLQNTARRADIQAGVRGRAYSDQAMSRTLHSIAEALSRGEARFLDGIRHKTQVETLDAVLYLAKWARIRSYQRQASEDTLRQGQRIDHIQQQPIGPETVRFAEYPFPRLYKRHLQDIIARGQNTKGVKQAADKMLKRLAREKEEYVTFHAEHDIKALSDFLDRAKTAGLDVGQAAASMENYKRLQRANIADAHELRATLREYLTHRAAARGDDPVKVAERELIGKDLPGFFPTPRPVIDRMLELDRVESHHNVLEPSCGKGDILDALKEVYPGVELHAIERNYTLSDVLSAKGHAVQFCDFLEHQGSYDRIIMNPPFENGQDIEHVQHAYSLLAPGGRLVSVVCEGPFFRRQQVRCVSRLAGRSQRGSREVARRFVSGTRGVSRDRRSHATRHHPAAVSGRLLRRREANFGE